MKYMLDTNICVFLIRTRPETVLNRLEKCRPGEVGISSVTLAELRYGAEKSLQVEKNLEALAGFTLALEIAAFDEQAVAGYGAVRTQLEAAGTPIGSMDMLIGAHALSLGATLVTNNTKELRRIKRLRVADWTK
jgi:tRNA(fMet)-specific endonuclease VapC